jgi:hypothetical protein
VSFISGCAHDMSSLASLHTNLFILMSQDKKKLELDDLDDLLGEFGISPENNTAVVEEKKVEDEPLPAETGEAAKKKKKKPKKKGGGKSSVESDDWVEVESPEGGDEVAVVDVAAVLKAKAKTKEKSAAEIAAATAAKEAKAKADKKAAEEKKKVCLPSSF